MTLNLGSHSGISSLMCSRCLIYFHVRSRLGSPEVEFLPWPKHVQNVPAFGWGDR